LFLSNLHPTHTLSFSWTLTSTQPAAEVVSIHPSEGYIAPGKSCVCRVTFYSHSSPAIYDLDIICNVVDETEMSEYQSQREVWARHQEERKHHFTICHPTPATTNEVRPQTIPKQKTLQLSAVRPRSSSNSDLRGSRYQVLPPIGARPPSMSYEDWKRQDLSIRSKARPRPTMPPTDKPPCPPTPLLLHLGLTAQTHSLTDYARVFGDLERFYIVPQTRVPSPEEGATLRMKTEERDLILSILREMARELLDDTNFHSALERVQREPVPYFPQFSSPRPPQPAQSNTQGEAPYNQSHSATATKSAGRVKDIEEREEFGSRKQGAVGGGMSDQQEVGEDLGRGAKETFSSTIVERSPEVECMIESILESTVLDIMRESEEREFNITAPHFLVAPQTL
jgi:hypothetical protein